MTDMIHRVCGKIAFRAAYKPHSPIRAVDARLLDGSIPETHSPMQCGSCGAYISSYDVKPDNG